MNTEIIIQPKSPTSKHWKLLDTIRVYMGIPAKRFISDSGHIAISSVEAIEDGHKENAGPEYHLSISKNGGRISADEIPKLLKIFDMDGADEDNHLGGIARHFWLPVAKIYAGYVCPCKKTEHAITNEDFTWRPLK